MSDKVTTIAAQCGARFMSSGVGFDAESWARFVEVVGLLLPPNDSAHERLHLDSGSRIDLFYASRPTAEDYIFIADFCRFRVDRIQRQRQAPEVDPMTLKNYAAWASVFAEKSGHPPTAAEVFEAFTAGVALGAKSVDIQSLLDRFAHACHQRGEAIERQHTDVAGRWLNIIDECRTDLERAYGVLGTYKDATGESNG